MKQDVVVVVPFDPPDVRKYLIAAYHACDERIWKHKVLRAMCRYVGDPIILNFLDKMIDIEDRMFYRTDLRGIRKIVRGELVDYRLTMWKNNRGIWWL